MSYEPGQNYFFPARRGPQAGLMPSPCWYAFRTPPRLEQQARDWFASHAIEAWFPVELVWRKAPRGSRRLRIQVEALSLPRYVFARFLGHPQWDILRGCRYLAGPVGCNGIPRPIRDSELEAIGMLPQRRAEHLEAARLAAMIKPGDRAEILDGAMQGWVIDVADVTGDAARILIPLLGNREVKVPVSRLAKLQPLA